MRTKAVGVFMGSQFGSDPNFKIQTEAFGKQIAKRGLYLVYGGGKDGLMGTLATSVMANKGNVLGISPRNLAEDAIDADKITKFIEVASMTERKQLLIDNSDVFVALPGGLGTLEEIAQVISWAKLGLHHKSLILYNINGFYDYFENWLNQMVNDHFVNIDDMKWVHVVNNLDEVMTMIDSM